MSSRKCPSGYCPDTVFSALVTALMSSVVRVDFSNSSVRNNPINSRELSFHRIPKLNESNKQIQDRMRFPER